MLQPSIRVRCGGYPGQGWDLREWADARRVGRRSGVPGPGLEMQYAILLICFLSSFASLGKVLLLEDENTDGLRPRKCRYTSYKHCYLKPQREQQ